MIKCVLIAILHGLRKLGEKRDASSICPDEVRADLEKRLGSNFWTDSANYEKEAMRVASLFGQAKQMVEYMT